MTSSSDSRKLESLPLENWESSLSFLPAREILLASHELSKSFGVEKNESNDGSINFANLYKKYRENTDFDMAYTKT